MLELWAGLLIFVAPSKWGCCTVGNDPWAVAPSEMTRGAAATSEMTLGAAAPSELLPDVV